MSADTPVDAAYLREWFRRASASIEAHRQELTDLDAAIGDADHGINMDRGFKTVLERLEAQGSAANTPGEAAKIAAMALISSVGGAAGPLYGTFFLRFASALGSEERVSAASLAAAFHAGLEGLQKRGGAVEGDKTIVDALLPACRALEEAVGSGLPLADALGTAERAAAEGVKATVAMTAKKGRASYLGERSQGHQDPGATSAHLIVKAAAEALGGG